MVPGSNEPTVRIPVQWIDGRWQLVGGGTLPLLTANVTADLVISSSCLADEEERARWMAETTIQLLAKGTELFARVNPENVPQSQRQRLEKMTQPCPRASAYVKIVLDGNLSLTVTPGKKGALLDCNCQIPALDAKANSVNEAYKKIVTVFEPNRRSNSGNVFLLVFVKQNDALMSLDILREQMTNDAALTGARLPERSETWHQLAISLSQVSELWGGTSKASETSCPPGSFTCSQTDFIFPSNDAPDLVKSGKEFFDHRSGMLTYGGAGLEAINRDLNDRGTTNHDIATLRELKAALDGAVLKAYGWHDLAVKATCDFLPVDDNTGDGTESSISSEERKTRNAQPTTQSSQSLRNPHQFRWPDDLRAEVLARLLKLNEQGHQGNPHPDGVENTSHTDTNAAMQKSFQRSQPRLF
jgi:hypothetical protein